MTGSAHYWCRRKLVVTVQGPHGRCVYKLNGPFARVGSHQSSEILLPAADVADCSLYLHATDSGLYSARLDSPALKSDAITYWQTATQPIHLGPYQLAAAADTEDSLHGTETGPGLNSAADEAARLFEVVSPRSDPASKHYRLEGEITLVGSQPPSTMLLEDPAVAPAHCVLFVRGDDCWVIDLFSGQGTRIADREIDVAMLAQHDVLEIGDLHLTYLGTADADGPASTTPVSQSGAQRRSLAGKPAGVRQGETSVDAPKRLEIPIQAPRPPDRARTRGHRESRASGSLPEKPSRLVEVTGRMTSKDGPSDRQERMADRELMERDAISGELTTRLARLGSGKRRTRLLKGLLIGVVAALVLASLVAFYGGLLAGFLK